MIINKKIDVAKDPILWANAFVKKISRNQLKKIMFSCRVLPRNLENVKLSNSFCSQSCKLEREMTKKKKKGKDYVTNVSFSFLLSFLVLKKEKHRNAMFLLQKFPLSLFFSRSMSRKFSFFFLSKKNELYFTLHQSTDYSLIVSSRFPILLETHTHANRI